LINVSRKALEMLMSRTSRLAVEVLVELKGMVVEVDSHLIRGRVLG